jgi:hypothetical protein
MPIPATLHFEGPFPLLPPLGSPWEISRFVTPGIYLFTVKVGKAYRILYVGEADHVANRLREHIEKYLSGNYWLYQAEDLQKGVRTPVWKPGQPAEITALHITDLHAALAQSLPQFVIFVARADLNKTELRRVESGIILLLRENLEANVFLENYRLSVAHGGTKEELRIVSDVVLYGLGNQLQV